MRLKAKAVIASSSSYFLLDFGGRGGTLYELGDSVEALAGFFAGRQFLSSDGAKIFKIPSNVADSFRKTICENPYTSDFKQYEVPKADPIAEIDI